jgi:hypothetical protein
MRAGFLRKTNMTRMLASRARVGLGILVGAILIAGIGDAVAKVQKRHWHARSFASARSVQLVSQQPARPGVMRYYGGPKSPMWRGPVEN